MARRRRGGNLERIRRVGPGERELGKRERPAVHLVPARDERGCDPRERGERHARPSHAVAQRHAEEDDEEEVEGEAHAPRPHRAHEEEDAEGGWRKKSSMVARRVDEVGG